jgi:hypothetical protein
LHSLLILWKWEESARTTVVRALFPFPKGLNTTFGIKKSMKKLVFKNGELWDAASILKKKRKIARSARE